MQLALESILLASLLALGSAAAQAEIISLDQYNNQGPIWSQDDYQYQGLGFSIYNQGVGYAGADWYGGFTIRITSHRGDFAINAVALATYQNIETDPAGPFAVRDITLTGFHDGVQVGTTAFHLDVTDGVYRWFGSSFNSPVDQLTLVGDGIGHLQGFTMNALDVTPVPEPETWALLGIGAVGLAARRWRARVTPAVGRCIPQ